MERLSREARGRRNAALAYSDAWRANSGALGQCMVWQEIAPGRLLYRLQRYPAFHIPDGRTSATQGVGGREDHQ